MVIKTGKNISNLSNRALNVSFGSILNVSFGSTGDIQGAIIYIMIPVRAIPSDRICVFDKNIPDITSLARGYAITPVATYIEGIIETDTFWMAISF